MIKLRSILLESDAWTPGKIVVGFFDKNTKEIVSSEHLPGHAELRYEYPSWSQREDISWRYNKATKTLFFWETGIDRETKALIINYLAKKGYKVEKIESIESYEQGSREKKKALYVSHGGHLFPNPDKVFSSHSPSIAENVESANDKISAFEKYLQTKYGKWIDDLMFYYDDFSKGIFLSDLYIKPQFRGEGYGGKIMNELTSFADTNNMPISLIPVSQDTPPRKLVKFYKKFGFVENVNNRLFDSTSMYRLPRKK
jgi:GNAT superfamily N-acetyltransferase